LMKLDIIFRMLDLDLDLGHDFFAVDCSD